MAELKIMEASIDELQAALSTGTLTSVELVALYLCRISRYDMRGPALNAIPVINPAVFEEAAASDDRRASGQRPVRPLEGIPYTVKDSYKVAGMTVAAGSPAFHHLIANEDAFTVAAIRAAGGVLIGRTNMPAMAYGGMQRGIYGRAESPYNPEYLAAAFGSGSSNGSAVATAASLAAFGMGEETVSSGRSPASNNGLVAYTPSRGCLSIRGNWPLYPTCDVVVPHTRTMRDMLALLDVIAQPDKITEGDFWRHQPFVKLPKEVWPEKPSSFKELATHSSLDGLRIAVPAMYVGGLPPRGVEPVFTCDAVTELWSQAKRDLEALGAQVVTVDDFPAVTSYENAQLLPDDCPRLPESWANIERGQLIAHAWNDFLKANGDSAAPDISTVDTSEIYPDRLRTAPERKYLAPANNIHFSRLAEYVQTTPLYETEDMAKALQTLETMRKRLFDDYLTTYGCDCFVFPAAGDVGAADADSNDASAEHAWKNGVKYSNGNRAIRHLGIPTVSVPMGVMPDKKMPVNLTFASRAYEDVRLLKWATAFETATQRRTSPGLTPSLPWETKLLQDPIVRSNVERPELSVQACTVRNKSTGDLHESNSATVWIDGQVRVHRREHCSLKTLDSESHHRVKIDISVNGHKLHHKDIHIVNGGEDNMYSFWVRTDMEFQNVRPLGVRTEALVARDKNLVVILARSDRSGRPSGWLGLV